MNDQNNELSDTDLEQITSGKSVVRMATIASLSYFKVKEALATGLW